MTALQVAPLVIFTAIAAEEDIRRREIPNPLSALGALWGMGLMVMHVLPWFRLLWAAGIWGLYELGLALQPGSVGWGDVKWASIVMGWLGAPGLVVLAWGHLGSTLWGTADWWRHGRQTPWSRSAGPWAPGALLGLLILIALGMGQGHGMTFAAPSLMGPWAAFQAKA